MDRFEVEVFLLKSHLGVCKMFRPFSNVIHSEGIIHDVSVHFYVQLFSQNLRATFFLLNGLNGHFP